MLSNKKEDHFDLKLGELRSLNNFSHIFSRLRCKLWCDPKQVSSCITSSEAKEPNKQLLSGSDVHSNSLSADFLAYFEDSDGRLKPLSVITCWIAFLTTSLLAVVVIKYNETMRYTKIYFLLAWNRVCFLLDVCPYKRSHFNTQVSVWKWLNIV